MKATANKIIYTYHWTKGHLTISKRIRRVSTGFRLDNCISNLEEIESTELREIFSWKTVIDVCYGYG